MRTLTGLLLIVLLHGGLKHRAYWTALGFEPGRSTFYWTESAMHEYLTERVVRGESLAGLDRRAQFPEGVDLRRDFTLGMPVALGTLYRWIGPRVPPDVFVAYAQVFISSLTVLGVFGLSRAVFASDAAALTSALFYAVATAGIARSVGGYLHEDFAHPLVVGALAVFVTGLPHAQLGFAILAATLTVTALASWHFTQFLWLTFALGLIVAVLAGRRLPARYLGTFTGLVLVGAVAVPSLRAQGVWASPAMALMIGLTIFTAGAGRFGRRGAFGLAAVACLGVGAAYASLGFGQQSHVFGLLLEKVRHGFVKPIDPRALSAEARSVWIEDDNSPGLFALIFYTSLYIPTAALGVSRIARARWTAASIATVVTASAGLVLFVVARRTVTTEIIWLSTLIGGVALWPSRRTKWAVGMVCLATLSFEFTKSWTFNRGGYVARYLERVLTSETDAPLSTFGDQTDLLAWIRTQTGPDDAILAPIGLSPVILQQTGRPIVLHSKWESKALRLKFDAYLTALFGEEARLVAFVRGVNAKYVVHDANTAVRTGPESARYMTGLDHLAPDARAYLFNYRPGALRNFRLVYQNSTYRIFEFGRDAVEPASTPVLFDEALARTASRETITARLFEQRARAKRAVELSQVDPAASESILLSLIKDGAREGDLEAYLCYARMAANDLDEAARHCRDELTLRPHSVTGRFHSGLLAELRGDRVTARGWYRRTLEADPRFAPALERLGTP